MLTQAATALASDGTTLYFATNSNIGGVTLPSGTPVSFGNVSFIRGLAVDGNTLWAATNAGTVLKLLRGAGGVSVVATIGGQSTPTAITLDANAVYWTNQGDGTVMRLAR